MQKVRFFNLMGITNGSIYLFLRYRTHLYRNGVFYGLESCQGRSQKIPEVL